MKSKRLLVCSGLLLCLIGYSQTVSCAPQSLPTSKTKVSPKQATEATLQKTITDYLNRFLIGDRWWYNHDSQPRKQLQNLQPVIDELTKLDEVLNSYQNAPDLEAQAIARTYYRHLNGSVTIYNSQTGSWLRLGVANNPTGRIQICFLSFATWQNMTAHAEMIRGVGILLPGRYFRRKPLTVGMFFHELGHQASADQHNSTTADLADDTYVDEEIRQHQLELRVANYESGGKFIPTLNRILKANQPNDWKQACLKISGQQLAQLAQAVNDSKPRAEDALFQMDSFRRSLAMQWIMVNLPKSKQQAALRQLYRYLRKIRPNGYAPEIKLIHPE